MKRIFEVMFVSRGRGKGHAVPDIAIASLLAAKMPTLRFRFVSYSTGAEVYRSSGLPVVDMRATEEPDFPDMVAKYAVLISKVRPKVVLAHEEYAVAVAAAASGVPCVFLTDYFSDPSLFYIRALRTVVGVVFLGRKGVFVEPPFLRGRVSYVGYAIRHFAYKVNDRRRARSEVGIPDGDIVAIFQPGGWTEERFPLVDLVMKAWELIPGSEKRLIYIAGADYESMSERLRNDRSVRVVRHEPQIDRLFSASNIVITKANRLTVFEAAAIGVPSISISARLNWADDHAISTIESNIEMFSDSISPTSLASAIMTSLSAEVSLDAAFSGGIDGAANILLGYIKPYYQIFEVDEMLSMV